MVTSGPCSTSSTRRGRPERGCVARCLVFKTSIHSHCVCVCGCVFVSSPWSLSNGLCAQHIPTRRPAPTTHTTHTPPYNQTRPSRYIWGCVLCTCKALSSMYYKYTTCSQLPQLYRYTTCSQNPSESKLRLLDVSRMPVTNHDEAQQRRTTTHNDDCPRRPAKRDDEAR